MDNGNNVNEKTLNDIYKNAHIALQSISNLMPQTETDKMKRELREQYDGYEKLIGEISVYMSEKGIQPKDINPMKKVMLWSSIKMKTLTGADDNKVADMMLNGTIMGISELTAIKNDAEKGLSPEVVDFAVKLLELEEKYEERLKTYL